MDWVQLTLLRTFEENMMSVRHELLQKISNSLVYWRNFYTSELGGSEGNWQAYCFKGLVEKNGKICTA